MAAINSGSILLSKAVLKTETVAFGTSPSFTSGGRRLMIDPTGYINAGLTVDDQSDKSVGLLVRAIAQRTTVTSKMPTLSLNDPAVPVNELPVWLSGVQYFAPTTVGTAAAATLGLAGTANAWDFNFVLSNGTSGTAIPSAKSFSVVATGGNSNPGTEQYLLNYVMPTKISLKASNDGLTSMNIDAFGQTLSKDTTVLADALPTDIYNMAGRLWKAYFYASAAAWGTDAAGTSSTGAWTGGTAFSYLQDWSLDISTPNQPIAYQAGTISFTGHSQFAAPLLGEMSFTLSGGTDAIAQVYDKFQAGTPSYWRLSWTDGTRQVDILACLIFTEVTPLSGDNNGVTTITARGVVNYDLTAAASLRIRVISDSLNALP
jgi:hypothetical protein